MDSKRIIPPDSCLSHLHASRRHTARTVVLIVVGLHIGLLGALLIQGCFHGTAQPAPHAVETSQKGQGVGPEIGQPGWSAESALPNKEEAGAPMIVSLPSNSDGEDGSTPDAYVVKRGDSLVRIAKVHRVTVRSIQELNGLRSDRIIAGQTLNLPAPALGEFGRLPVTSRPSDVWASAESKIK